MTLNRELLIEVMEKIEKGDVKWDQGTWINSVPGVATEENLCGTSKCFAGHAIYLAKGMDGFQVAYTETRSVFYPAGKLHNIDKGWLDAGAEVLGISIEDAEYLFYVDNDVETLREFVDVLLSGRSIVEHCTSVDVLKLETENMSDYLRTLRRWMLRRIDDEIDRRVDDEIDSRPGIEA